MSDPLLRQTNDGGDLEIENGLVLMSEGLETAAYLSLFGGNEEDGGDAAGLADQWWGNIGEADAALVYRSETQNLVRALPSVPANLKRIEQAAARDLAWMLTTGVALRVDVAASIPAMNRVRLEVSIVTPVRTVQLVFN
jgi:phage gp46-like protein